MPVEPSSPTEMLFPGRLSGGKAALETAPVEWDDFFGPPVRKGERQFPSPHPPPLTHSVVPADTAPAAVRKPKHNREPIAHDGHYSASGDSSAINSEDELLPRSRQVHR